MNTMFLRGQYHECLSKSHYRPALQRLACAGMRENFTLLHAGDDPEHNCATALREFIVELESLIARRGSSLEADRQDGQAFVVVRAFQPAFFSV